MVEEVVSDPLLLKVISAKLIEAQLVDTSIPNGPLGRAVDQVMEVVKPLVIARGDLTEEGQRAYGIIE